MGRIHLDQDSMLSRLALPALEISRPVSLRAGRAPQSADCETVESRDLPQL